MILGLPTRTAILVSQGFSVILGRRGAVFIESAGEPEIDAIFKQYEGAMGDR